MNPFDTMITADIFKKRPIGQGITHTVYNHPTSQSHVVRVPNIVGDYPPGIIPETSVAQPVELPRNLKGRFGLPVSETPHGIQVLNRVNGNDLGYMGDMTPKEYVHQVNTLRKMPQEAYTKMRRDMRTVTNSGGFLDPHVGNVKVGPDRFGILDVGEPSEIMEEGRDSSRWKNTPRKVKDVAMVNQITGLASEGDVRHSMPKMTPKRQNIVMQGLNNIFGKLSVAGKVIPALAIPEMLRIGKSVQNVIGGKSSPMEEYTKSIGVQTYDPMKDYL